jgi:hypothetical protein
MSHSRPSLLVFPAQAKFFFKEVLLLESAYGIVKHEQDARVDTNRLPEHDDGCSTTVVPPRSRPCHCRTCHRYFLQRRRLSPA